MSEAKPELLKEPPTSDRVKALERSRLLDTPPERSFDHLTEFASTVLKVPVALMSLVSHDRQFFKSQVGLPDPWSSTRQTPLTHSFCQYVTKNGEAFVVDDARSHPLVQDNLAVSDIGVVAYAGVPLRDAEGQPIGAFCAIDSKPRVWTSEELGILKALAAQVMTEMELRTRSAQLTQSLDDLRAMEAERQSMAQLTIHDLRTPLMGITMTLELLNDLGPLNAAQQGTLGLLRRGTKVLSNLVDQLLDIGSIDQRGGGALHTTTCKVRTLVDAALEQVAPLAAGKRQMITTEGELSGMWVACDADKIARVLVNLLGNAVKFTPGGGAIGVTAVVEPAADKIGTRIRFTVSDTGIGIAPEDCGRIFEVGEKLQPAVPTSKSAGLGLAFCRKVVEAHGSSMDVESIPGKGSRFSFALPASSNPASAS